MRWKTCGSAGGVGDYVVRVYARNRREVMRLYDEMFERGVDPLSDEFQQARKNLEGLEQYLLQLWREYSGANTEGPFTEGRYWAWLGGRPGGPHRRGRGRPASVTGRRCRRYRRPRGRRRAAD